MSGCTASDLQPSTTGFAKATVDAQTSFLQYQAQLDKAVVDVGIAEAIRNPAAVDEEEGDCALGSSRCRVFVNAGEKLPLTPGATDRVVEQIMSAIVAYGANLTAIAHANTATEIQTALMTAKANVVGLAKSTDALAVATGQSGGTLATTVEAAAGPVTDLVNFGLTRYAERVRMRALRDAVLSMEEIFPTVVLIVSQTPVTADLVRRTDLANSFWVAKRAFGRGHKAEDLRTMLQAANAYDVALQTKPQAVIEALGEAHSMLARAVARDRMSFAELLPFLQRVTDEVVQLATIANQLDSLVVN